MFNKPATDDSFPYGMLLYGYCVHKTIFGMSAAFGKYLTFASAIEHSYFNLCK